MTDDDIAEVLQEVGAAWLMDKDDEMCQTGALRHLVAAVTLRERERCALICDEAKAAVWPYHEPEVLNAARTVCENLANRIRGVGA